MSHGPFSQDEITLMRANGTIQQYHWIWSAEQVAWMPLDPPPPPLAQAPHGHHRGSTGRTSNTPAGMLELGKRETFDTILCHNGHHVLVGEVVSLDGWSCTFSAHHDGATPALALQHGVSVRLSNTRGADRSGTRIARGTLIQARFEPEHHRWVYRIQWQAQAPVMVLDSHQKAA